MAFFPLLASAGVHSGKIFLQVEQNGEAWYVYPPTNHKYYLGRPDDAFSIMRNLGLGISNANLDQIPIGTIDTANTDSDLDGLSNDLETAIGTDPYNPDTDNDDFPDKTEIDSWNDPKGAGSLQTNNALINNLRGRILLQVEKNGEAWYLNPDNSKRYYLGRPNDAFAIMRSLGVGITDANLAAIDENYVKVADNSNDFFSYTSPGSWTKTDVTEDGQTYGGIPVTQVWEMKPSSDTGEMYLYFLESPKRDYTLGDFSRYEANYERKLYEKDGLKGVKPFKKQKFEYTDEHQLTKELTVNKGATLFADIMLNTKQFISLYMHAYNEANVASYEKIFESVFNDIQIK